ncbi:flotillin-like protein FloA, partial [Strepomyces sp. STD 3.1]|nr:flotillin-like protein FloA [Streptomyces sp. STD 3.1]
MDITVLILIGLGIILLGVFFTFVPVMLWISALAAGVRVSIFTLVGMRLRRVIPSRVVNPLIKAKKAGLEVTINQLESHYLAGGNVDRVINALIAAHRANIDLSFERCAAIDLAGRDVLEAVQMSVNPKVIETPFIAGVAMDGIEVKAKARITVRANIDRLVGGAGEDTVIARVGEGIVSTIGSQIDHKKVLENPDMISQTVLSKGLDSGTAFEILSIDIADIDIGKNIGAVLQIDQAEADKNIAQAKAEERRAMAVAQEQEMRARVEEMRAKVVEAEA